MLRATIRPVETVTVEVKAEGLPAIYAELAARRPEGFELTAAPASMSKGETEITAHATYARRDGLSQIEGETLADLTARLPDGWEMLHIIRV